MFSAVNAFHAESSAIQAFVIMIITIITTDPKFIKVCEQKGFGTQNLQPFIKLSEQKAFGRNIRNGSLNQVDLSDLVETCNCS